MRLLSLLLVAVALSACQRGADHEGPEAEIAAAIAVIEAAAEAGDAAGVMAHVDREYTDDYAGSRMALERLVRRASAQELGADIEIEEITVGDDGYATSVVRGDFRSASMGRGRFRITATWVDDGDWRVERASWEELR